MQTLAKHSLLLSLSVSTLIAFANGEAAVAQDSKSTELPEITVTSPSPIVRRHPIVAAKPIRVARSTQTRPGRNTAPPAEARPAPVTSSTEQGVLPIVTNQFATVTVVPNEEIRREGGATLGDLLFAKPGITGSSFAPGASSHAGCRPS